MQQPKYKFYATILDAFWNYLNSDIIYNRYWGFSDNPPHTEEEFQQDAERWIKNWKREFRIDDMDAPLSDENKKGAESRRKLLSEMIDFCLVRELRPVLVLPPMHPSLSRLFTKEFRENYIYSFLRRTNTRNILFLDYFDDKRFVSAENYDNSFFLSQEGARRFTRIVLEDVGLSLI